jgi:hypothetical protein
VHGGLSLSENNFYNYFCTFQKKVLRKQLYHLISFELPKKQFNVKILKIAHINPTVFEPSIPETDTWGPQLPADQHQPQL